MKALLTLIFLFSLLTLKGTEQTPDILIHKSDTIYIDQFPLEVLLKQDSTLAQRLDDDDCLSSDCWRQYIGIWKIENNHLFLVGLKDCCEYKEIPLDKIFNKSEIQNEKIQANWYTETIKAGFGKWLAFNEDKGQSIYEKRIELNIVSGEVKNLVILKTKL